ncbi:MAG: hypothetical protein WC632_00495 [Candidatus Margulisiibacteriota bacterium]
MSYCPRCRRGCGLSRRRSLYLENGEIIHVIDSYCAGCGSFVCSEGETAKDRLKIKAAYLKKTKGKAKRIGFKVTGRGKGRGKRNGENGKK